MRPESEYQDALKLIKAGVNDCEIGRRLGIPRGTIRDLVDLLGIHWTKSYDRVISVARRKDVAFLDTFVGPKS